jgi:regulator of protease activity HflC (stomatin/prohibitin superfamily)
LITAVVLLVLVIFVLVALLRSAIIVPQGQAVILQRLGRYHATLKSGLHVVVPFIDAVRASVDLRESPHELRPMPVITKDNATVNVDAVAYVQVTDPQKAVYEVTNYLLAVERLVQTTLRNVIGDLTLDETLTSRERINALLQQHLDEATDKWGVKVNRIELRTIDPPDDIRQAMEKQMIAERLRRAAVTEAEGQKQAAVLRAEGEKQATVLQAEAQRQKRILEAEGEAQAILAIRRAQAEGLRVLKEVGPDAALLALQGMETFRAAVGPTDKTVVVPTDLAALAGAAGLLRGTLSPGRDGGAAG